jgi:hypothetical protein
MVFEKRRSLGEFHARLRQLEEGLFRAEYSGDWRVWSFARNFGLGDETEGLHFVWVLSLGEEFREDVGLGGIQEKFWPALA